LGKISITADAQKLHSWFFSASLSAGSLTTSEFDTEQVQALAVYSFDKLRTGSELIEKRSARFHTVRRLRRRAERRGAMVSS
jgi:hypothetical protein